MNLPNCEAGSFVKADEIDRAVYEHTEENRTGQRLVLTTWMLLDELKQCQDEIEGALNHIHETGMGQENRCGFPYNPVAASLEKAHFNVSHILRLLWRSGLWTEGCVTERRDTDGRTYRVFEEPFTDGKANGRVLPTSTPKWQRELLGIPDVPENENYIPTLAEKLRFLEQMQASFKQAA